MILTPEEVEALAPAIALEDAELETAIAGAQSLMESSFGANRPLGLTRFTDTLNLSNDGRAYLSTFPIVPHSVATPWTIKIRGGGSSAYGIGAINTGWQTLELDNIAVDADTGEIQVLGTVNLIPAFGQAYRSRHRSQQRARHITIQVSYWSGFDLSLADEAIPPELKALKHLAIQIIGFQQSDMGQGVRSRSVDKEYSVSYASPQIVGQNTTGSLQLDNLLKSLEKYRPRSYGL